MFFAFQGSHWEHVNSPQALIAISTCNNIIWTIGRKGELYYRDGITKENQGGTGWKLIEAPTTFPYVHKTSGGAKSVSLTKCAAWVVLSNGTIAVRADISNEQQDGKQWKYLSGNNVLMLLKALALQGQLKGSRGMKMQKDSHSQRYHRGTVLA